MGALKKRISRFDSVFFFLKTKIIKIKEKSSLAPSLSTAIECRKCGYGGIGRRGRLKKMGRRSGNGSVVCCQTRRTLCPLGDVPTPSQAREIGKV